MSAPVAPASDARKQTIRMVAASFIAGAGAMVFVGLVAPMVAQGGLSVRDAMAATLNSDAPAIQPLDVTAINAQLAQADVQMQSTRAATDREMTRLDQLSGR